MDLDAFCKAMDGQDHDPSKRARDWRLLTTTLSEIRFHAQQRYWQFTPAYAGDFERRLSDWVGNAGLRQRDRRLLLESVPEIQFVDRDDLMALYRAAFRGPIYRWLIDQQGLTFTSLGARVKKAINRAGATTWFCPVTDSMDISQFLHVNNLPGAEHRPAWRVLKKFGSQNKIRAHLRQRGYKRVVLLEDFVGSGRQAAGPLLYAAKRLGRRVPILLVPLIASQPGVEKLQRDIRNLPNVAVDPVFVVPRHVQIAQTPVPGEAPFAPALRALSRRLFERIAAPADAGGTPLTEALGFGGLGMLLVLYTNCPNNTLPLVWHSNAQWRALFPRVSRS